MPTSAASVAHALNEFRQRRQQIPTATAVGALCAELRGAAEAQWLQAVQALIRESDPAIAVAVVTAALEEFPQSIDLRRALGGAERRAGNDTAAETALRFVLERHPDDAAAAFSLAELLADQGRVQSAAECLRACVLQHRHDADLLIRAIEFLDGNDRKADAAALADEAIAAHPNDVRPHAYAGMLKVQLGEFEAARRHHQHVLQHSEQAFEWNIPLGLAQTHRYRDPGHPDFAVFARGLARRDLSDAARTSLLFATAKAHDDVGDYAAAANYLNAANASAERRTRWTPAWWSDQVNARLAAPLLAARSPPTTAPAPVFVVGVPRSGTTLLAELLARMPRVCNRGELPWIPWLFDQTQAAPASASLDLDSVAATYQRHLQRDDADAHWYIDKQPLNLRYLDFILALWPHAKIVCCTRAARDTALSLWMQLFHDDLMGFAYRFSHIAHVMRDCERLLARWRAEFPASIRCVPYEHLVLDPRGTVDELVAWIGIDAAPAAMHERNATSSIGTASVWQARQPVYLSSVGRWRHYAPFIAQLSDFAEDNPDAARSAVAAR